jgi:hypothetical protein
MRFGSNHSVLFRFNFIRGETKPTEVQSDLKISCFRPLVIERSVAVAASIFSGVALATTIEFAANLGTTSMAVLGGLAEHRRVCGARFGNRAG